MAIIELPNSNVSEICDRILELQAILKIVLDGTYQDDLDYETLEKVAATGTYIHWYNSEGSFSNNSQWSESSCVGEPGWSWDSSSC